MSDYAASIIAACVFVFKFSLVLHVPKYVVLCRHSESTQFELDEAIVIAALAYVFHIHSSTYSHGNQFIAHTLVLQAVGGPQVDPAQ